MGIVRFVFFFSLFALLVFTVGKVLASLFEGIEILSPSFTVLVVFLYFITLIVYFLSVFGLRLGDEYSVFSLLGGIVIKMLFSLSFIFYLFLKTSENHKVLALNFFSIYFLFTLFEVTVILRNLRDQNKK